MDATLTPAARALARGDALRALNQVALRDDAPALALRGIAMAQLGDLARARGLLRRAARAFGAAQPLPRARCVVAQAEVALAARDLGTPVAALAAARATLQAHGDRVNATHAHQLAVRRLLLLGRLDEAQRALDALDAAAEPPALRAVHHLLAAGIALRRVRAQAAHTALTHAGAAATRSGIPALVREVAAARRELERPAARLIARGSERPLRLAEIETVLQSPALIVDACRCRACAAGTAVALASRPVLFALLRTLAEAWPRAARRDTLVARAFRLRLDDESQRARLRVEIGRLRRLLQSLAGVRATRHGFVLLPCHAPDVVVLAPPMTEPHAALLALLADGQPWSSSALARALASSQRHVQRNLSALAAEGKVQPLGHGRARRWSLPSPPGCTTLLLLPTVLPDTRAGNRRASIGKNA